MGIVVYSLMHDLYRQLCGMVSTSKLRSLLSSSQGEQGLWNQDRSLEAWSACMVAQNTFPSTVNHV